ncbi:MAG TPA: rhodanese-like domain-containing protein [Burkholderiaceae bacterium]|nr:rhodanese-like domain-containing protein [Burkholderiaceae bacterium]
MRQISAKELAEWRADPQRPAPQLLDVREAWEFDLCRLEGAQHVPMREIPASVDRLDPARPVVCICHHGGRSQQVAIFLESRGFSQVYNLSGGVDAWSRDVDPALRRY